MNDYTPNSHKFREGQQTTAEERKKPEKVISGTAKVKKKTGAQKFADVFIADDISTVKHYFIYEVVIPILKGAICDIGKRGLDGLFGGKKSGYSDSRVDKVAFRDYSAISRFDSVPYTGSESKRVYSYDKVIIDTRGEAEEIIVRMDEIMKEYGNVSVADFYELAGVTDYDFTAHDYGWKDIRSADVLRVGEGYMLKLPKAFPINKK